MSVKFGVACVAGGISRVSANFSKARGGKKAARREKNASPLAKIPRGLYQVGASGATESTLRQRNPAKSRLARISCYRNEI